MVDMDGIGMVVMDGIGGMADMDGIGVMTRGTNGIGGGDAS
jgi:hypothetical protein